MPMRMALLWIVAIAQTVAAQDAGQNWYRCNTHTHTGAPGPEVNASALEAARWYQSHGYQCVVFTDHEHVTDVEAINRTLATHGEFLVMTGQEIGQARPAPDSSLGTRYYHINGLNIPSVIWPLDHPGAPASTPSSPRAQDLTPAQIYQRHIDAIYAAGGIPQVNHPNLQWSVLPDDLLPVSKPFLLEVWNAFPTSNNLGGLDGKGGRTLSTEQLWDTLLTAGRVVYGTATDDTHDYVNFDRRESTPTPGKAWIVVRAPSLTRQNFNAALLSGEFYASTGVALESYRVDDKGISLVIAQVPDWNPRLPGSTRFTTRFIGQGGRVLKEVAGEKAAYSFDGSEKYVRVAVTDSDGRRGWMQPVFRDGRPGASRPR